jgi:toxin ParE1/3/4
VKARLLAPALEEVVDAALWFDAQRIGLGGEFWQAVDAILVRIEENPSAFPKSEFCTPQIDIRFAVVRRFNYVIHFLVESNDVQVVSVAHAARKPGYWLRRSKK